MVKKKKVQKIRIKKIFLGGVLQVFVFVIVVNAVLLYGLNFYIRGQTCLTTDQVVSDTRCLYIASNKVYEMGSKNSPHKGHACGTDVTSLLPSSHDLASYLTPNYVGDICTVAPTAVPTEAASPTLTPEATVIPSDTPTVAPTETISTPIPSNFVPSPNCLGGCVTPELSLTPSPTPLLLPTQAADGQGGNNNGIFGLLALLIMLIMQFFAGLFG